MLERQTSKQLADRARPAIYLGRAARLDNASSLDSHFFMTDTEEFHRATHFMLDYSRPPPGWPFRAPGDRARSVDVLSELLALPESFDVGTYLVDELPLPGAVLPDYADEEGAAPSVVPDGLLNSLPNADPVPIISDVSTRFPVKTFDLTPPSTGSEPSPSKRRHEARLSLAPDIKLTLRIRGSPRIRIKICSLEALSHCFDVVES